MLLLVSNSNYMFHCFIKKPYGNTTSGLNDMSKVEEGVSVITKGSHLVVKQSAELL